MSCILIDSHFSDGDQLAMHDVFPLRGIDLFNSFMGKSTLLRHRCHAHFYLIPFTFLELTYCSEESFLLV